MFNPHRKNRDRIWRQVFVVRIMKLAYKMYTTSNVSMLTGNYLDQVNDLTVNGPGAEMTLQRTYNSVAGKEATIIGRGWRLNYDSSVKEVSDAGKVTATMLNVRTEPFGTIITAISRNTEVTYLEKNGAQASDGGYWHYVRLADGRMGYVAAKYMEDISGIEVTYGSGTKITFTEEKG